MLNYQPNSTIPTVKRQNCSKKFILNPRVRTKYKLIPQFTISRLRGKKSTWYPPQAQNYQSTDSRTATKRLALAISTHRSDWGSEEQTTEDTDREQRRQPGDRWLHPAHSSRPRQCPSQAVSVLWKWELPALPPVWLSTAPLEMLPWQRLVERLGTA